MCPDFGVYITSTTTMMSFLLHESLLGLPDAGNHTDLYSPCSEACMGYTKEKKIKKNHGYKTTVLN